MVAGEAVAHPTVVETTSLVTSAVSPNSYLPSTIAAPIETSDSDFDLNQWERTLFENFEPSRKRRRTAILASTAALTQRSGSVLPGLLPRGVSPRAALALAQGMSPFDKALKLAFPPDTHRRVRFTNEHPKLTKCLRRRVIVRLRKLSNRLHAARSRLTHKLPTKAPARLLNIPLIMLLVDKLDYPDKTSLRHGHRGGHEIDQLPFYENDPGHDELRNTCIQPRKHECCDTSQLTKSDRRYPGEKVLGPLRRGIPRRMAPRANTSNEIRPNTQCFPLAFASKSNTGLRNRSSA